MKGVNKMINIELGIKNNVVVYGIMNGCGISALSSEDLKFCVPTCKITVDSGCYPSIDNLDQYFCDKAFKALLEIIS
jgi:hypothetical protein